MFVSAHFIFSFVFLEVLYRIVIVFRLVITDCASLAKFLLICVITPCYVIIFVLLVILYTVNLFKEMVIY